MKALWALASGNARWNVNTRKFKPWKGERRCCIGLQQSVNDVYGVACVGIDDFCIKSRKLITDKTVNCCSLTCTARPEVPHAWGNFPRFVNITRIKRYSQHRGAGKMFLEQNGIKWQKIKLFLKSDSKILFTEFAESSQLKKIDPAFDAGKQPQGIGYKIFTWFADVWKRIDF